MRGSGRLQRGVEPRVALTPTRRALLVAMGVLTLSPGSLAQQRPAPPLVIFLAPGSLGTQLQNGWYQAFRASLVENGLIEGRDLTLERISAEGHYERLPDLARDAV